MGAGRRTQHTDPHEADRDGPAGRGFTAAYCGRPRCGCAPAGLDDAEVVEALRRTVRSCPHAVLVATGCLTAGRCGHTGPGPGRYVLVQPCDSDRRPCGRGVVVGPLHDRADVDDLCRWMTAGATTPCPAHLLAGPPGQRRART